MPSDFKKLLVARFFYSFGTQMQAVIVGWQMYDLTRDPLALGLIGLTAAVPALSLALYAGYIVDRGHPVVILQRVLFCSLLSGIVVLVPQIFDRAFDLNGRILALYVASFITG